MKTTVLMALALASTATALPKANGSKTADAKLDSDAPPAALAALDDPSRAPFAFSAVILKAELGDGFVPKDRYWITVQADTTAIRKQTKQEQKKSLLVKGHCFLDGKKFADKGLFIVMKPGGLSPGETTMGGTGMMFGGGLASVPKKCELTFGMGELMEDEGFAEYAKFCWDGSSTTVGGCKN
jgi:hypothetical protein